MHSAAATGMRLQVGVGGASASATAAAVEAVAPQAGRERAFRSALDGWRRGCGSERRRAIVRLRE